MPVSPIHFSFSPHKHLMINDLFTISIISSFPECHTVALIYYVAIWNKPPSNLCLRFLYVFCGLDSSFLCMTEWYSIVWMYHSLLIHSLDHSHLDCFQFLAVISKTALNICFQVLCVKISTHLGKHREHDSWCIGVYGKRMLSFIRKCQTSSQSGYTNLLSERNQ